MYISADSKRRLIAALLCLAGASVAIFVTGSEEEWANIAFIGCAAMALLVGLPSERPGWVPVLLLALLVACSAAALLPVDLIAEPAWRRPLSMGGVVELAGTVSPQPWFSLFWLGLLFCSVLIVLFLLCSPLGDEGLAVFLHAASVVVGVYAVLAIADFHTAWNYPFRAQAPFGFLPNKNHTATLLVVGSILSFGLMFWQVNRGSRIAASLAALTGAPPLAALLFFSNARAGVVFLVFGLFVWILGAARGRARSTVLVAAAALGVFAGALFIGGGSEVRDRLHALIEKTFAVQNDGAEAGGTATDVDFRQPVFRDTTKLIRDHAWTGTGLGQFVYVFPHYREETVRAARILHPESDWLMVASESGLPAVATLLALLVWYVCRSWRGRSGPGGLLHWTAASAVLATVAHASVDVPWHRPAVGWFLMVVAAVALPPSGLGLRRVWPARIFFLCGAAALVAVCVFLGTGNSGLPTPYQWKSYASRLHALGQAMRYDEGLELAEKSLRIFPLEPEAHYWALAFSRTDGDRADAFTESARRIDAVSPQLAQGQASLWKNFDVAREAEAWVEAVKRSLVVDQREEAGMSRSAASMAQHAVMSMRGKPDGQRVLLEEFANMPDLQVACLRQADDSVVEEFLAGLTDADSWLDTLPSEPRSTLLNRWVSLPSGSKAVAYMEARNSPAPGPYWRQLSNVYAKAGDKERAVRVVAEAEGISLQGRPAGGDFGRQLALLEGQGNEVAVRRLLKEAAEAKTPDPERLSFSMAWYAAAGDWESAWKAASRLVTTSKKGQ